MSAPHFILDYPPFRKIGMTVLNALDFGAVGDGLTDTTAQIQAALNALPKDGGTVFLPAGLYLIDPVRSLKPKSFTRLQLDPEAALVCMAHNRPRSRVILIEGVEEVEVLLGGGTQSIVGDRDTHQYLPQANPAENTHEWNHGIWVRDSKHVTIVDGTIRDFPGDGVSVSGEDIWVFQVKGIRNRRQGCTVGRGKDIHVERCEFTDTGGTSPSAGIDVEPDAPGGVGEVYIRNNKLQRNKVGLLIFTRVEPDGQPSATVQGVEVYDNEVAFNVNGIETVRASGVDIMYNFIHDQTATGLKIGEASGVHAAENRFLNNYSRLSVRVREELELFGWTKSLDRDILTLSTAGPEVFLGRNYYMKQPAT